MEFEAGYVEIIRRTGRFAIRIHDRNAPALAAFAGVPVYEPDAKWLLAGRFERSAKPGPSRPVPSSTVSNIITARPGSSGSITTAVSTRSSRSARQAGRCGCCSPTPPAGVTTYRAARRLDIGVPGENGSVTLDFTRSENLPCAFTDAATCPVAPAENRLPFAVEAGERNPRNQQ